MLVVSKYALANVETRAADFPATFRIPSIEDRATLRVGDYAKLIFLHYADPLVESERMWVRVDHIGVGSYSGTLDNDPIYVPLERGAPITFYPNNVAAIICRA